MSWGLVDSIFKLKIYIYVVLHCRQQI